MLERIRMRLLQVRLCCAFLLAVTATSWPSLAPAGITVALTPSSTTVDPGSDLWVRIEVTEAGDAFNGYEARVSFDPSALTFVAASPLSLQEGSAMTSACPTRFHIFESDPLPLSITHTLVCAGVSITGPGELYILHFIASETTQFASISFDDITFYNAGYWVEVTSAAGATIQIGNPSDTPAMDPIPGKQRVTAMPNPFNPSTLIEVRAAASGEQALDVFDARGRLVRSLQRGWFQSGMRHVIWDGRDDTGAPLPSGSYFVRLRERDRSTARHVVLIK